MNSPQVALWIDELRDIGADKMANVLSAFYRPAMEGLPGAREQLLAAVEGAAKLLDEMPRENKWGAWVSARTVVGQMLEHLAPPKPVRPRLRAIEGGGEKTADAFTLAQPNDPPAARPALRVVKGGQA